jgi:hypothetical protein
LLRGQAALIARSESLARTRLFYRYWTLGEAFIKATGEGIAKDLTSFAFTEEGAPTLTRVSARWGRLGAGAFIANPDVMLFLDGLGRQDWRQP